MIISLDKKQQTISSSLPIDHDYERVIERFWSDIFRGGKTNTDGLFIISDIRIDFQMDTA